MIHYLIDGQIVAILPQSIKNYYWLGLCYYLSGKEYPCELYVREDGKIIDPLDIAMLLPPDMYNEDGNIIQISEEFFILDSIEGFEYANQLFICDLTEKA